MPILEITEIRVQLPTYPEGFLRGVLAVNRIKISVLAEMLALNRGYLTGMMGGKHKMSGLIFNEVCGMLDLSPQKIREAWPSHFNEWGDLPQRGVRPYDER